MDYNALDELTRPKKLAVRAQIKANVRKADMIRNLLAKYPEGVPMLEEDAGKEVRPEPEVLTREAKREVMEVAEQEEFVAATERAGPGGLQAAMDDPANIEWFLEMCRSLPEPVSMPFQDSRHSTRRNAPAAAPPTASWVGSSQGPAVHNMMSQQATQASSSRAVSSALYQATESLEERMAALYGDPGRASSVDVAPSLAPSRAPVPAPAPAPISRRAPGRAPSANITNHSVHAPSPVPVLTAPMSMSTPGPAPRPIIRGTSVQGATKAQWEMAQWVNDDVYTQQLVAEVLALRAHVDEVAETIETGVEGLMRRQRVLERYLLPQVRRNGEHERGRWAPGPDFLAWQEREECGGRAEEPAVAEPQAEAHAQQDEMEASGSEKDGAEERAVSERQTEEVRAQVVDQDEMEASSGEKDDVDDWDLIPFPPSRSPYRPNKRLPDDYDYDRAMVERALKRQRS